MKRRPVKRFSRPGGGWGRRATVHTAATRELEALTREAAATVRAMDARLRLRYQEDRAALEQ
jgi:hypothetical protein